jgi:hypothetical protein
MKNPTEIVDLEINGSGILEITNYVEWQTISSSPYFLDQPNMLAGKIYKLMFIFKIFCNAVFVL